MALHPTVAKVTDRIVERSKETRRAYLDLIDRAKDAGVNRPTLSCGNLAHGFAASGEDKATLRTGKALTMLATADIPPFDLRIVDDDIEIRLNQAALAQGAVSTAGPDPH